jgi:hypothetical protein
MTPGTDIILAYSSDPASVRRSINALRAQTTKDWRVCLCAGATEPASLDREGDERITIQTKLARTQPAAWNHALDQFAARTTEPIAFGSTGQPGEFVMLLFPGDELIPDALERLIDHANRTLSDGATAPYLREPGPEQPHGAWTLRHGTAPFATVIGLRELHTHGPIRSPACITRRSAFERTRYGAGLGEHALDDMQLRQAERGVSWAVLEAPLASRRGKSPVTDLPGRAERAEHTVRRGVGRAVSAGFETAGMDLSAPRESELVMRAVLVEATLAALMDPEPRKAKATELLRKPWDGLEDGDDEHDREHPQDGLAPRPKITGAMAADAASIVLRAMLVVHPDPSQNADWTEPLNHWWNRLVGEKWAVNDLVASARADLAARLTPDESVADAILDAVGDAPTLHTIGDPIHSKTLARLAAGRAKNSRSMKVIEIDPSQPSAASGDIPIVVAGRSSDEERELLGLLGPRGNVHRWRAIEQRHVARTAEALERAWLQRPVASTAW